MTKRTLCLVGALALLLLCACERESVGNIRTETVDGVTYTIDTEEGTISDGRFTYLYTIQGNSITITYPNGAEWWMDYRNNIGAGGWSDNYYDSVSEAGYPDGYTLERLVFSPQRSSEQGGSPLLGFLMIILGIFNLASPRTAWYLSYGWHYKDAEPSDVSLALARVGGGVLVLVGVIMLFAA